MESRGFYNENTVGR